MIDNGKGELADIIAVGHVAAPSFCAIGPWRQSATEALPVVVAIPRRLKSGSSRACAAARTTGNSAGTQPAITHW